MIKKNKKIADYLSDKKTVLNQSLLDKADVGNLEYDTKINFFANIPPIDDRNEFSIPINNLLVKLGFRALNNKTESSNTQDESEKGSNLIEGMLCFFKK